MSKRKLSRVEVKVFKLPDLDRRLLRRLVNALDPGGKVSIIVASQEAFDEWLTWLQSRGQQSLALVGETTGGTFPGRDGRTLVVVGMRPIPAGGFVLRRGERQVWAGYRPRVAVGSPEEFLVLILAHELQHARQLQRQPDLKSSPQVEAEAERAAIRALRRFRRGELFNVGTISTCSPNPKSPGEES